MSVGVANIINDATKKKKKKEGKQGKQERKEEGRLNEDTLYLKYIQVSLESHRRHY